MRRCTAPTRLTTAKALAKVIGTVEVVELVIAGNEATDGRSGAVPAMLAEVLGWPQLTLARKVSTDGSSAKVERETYAGILIGTRAIFGEKSTFRLQPGVCQRAACMVGSEEALDRPAGRRWQGAAALR
jgi:electron transfer flavoprotein alpha subunit